MTVLATLNLLNHRDSLEDRRLTLLGRELATLNPDVLALQEVLPSTDHRSPFDEGTLETLTSAGLSMAIQGSPVGPRHHRNVLTYRADRLQLRASGVLPPLFEDDHRVREEAPTVWAAFAQGDDDDVSLVVFSIHGAWGAEFGWARAGQARQIAETATALTRRFPAAKVFAMGDFNEPASAAGQQFLRGRTDAEPGTFWVDVWEWLRGDEAGITVDAANPWAQQTAAEGNLQHATLVAPRRIDFVLAFGWVYASLGKSPQIDFWAHDPAPVSDHYGLTFRFDL